MFSGSQAVANDTRTKPLTQVEEKFSVFTQKETRLGYNNENRDGILKTDTSGLVDTPSRE
jgi:hypothetical protein